MNEFEAHEGSYDHQHKKRLKEMKALQRDPMYTQRARQAEARAERESGIQKINISLNSSSSSSSGKGGFKKAGFKKAFEPETPEEEAGAKKIKLEDGSGVENGSRAGPVEDEESDLDEGEDRYDPRNPTDCHPNCPGRH